MQRSRPADDPNSPPIVRWRSARRWPTIPAWRIWPMLHALTLRLFYNYTSDTCLQVEAKDTLTRPSPALPTRRRQSDRRRVTEAGKRLCPNSPQDLWDMLASLDTNSREALFAHCAGLTINAVHEPHVRISGKRRHADQLAAR